MKIIIKQQCLIGTRVYPLGDILDLEITGEKKHELVRRGVADWVVEVPKVETATIETPENAAMPKPAKRTIKGA